MRKRLLLVAAGIVAAAGLFTASFALAGTAPATIHLTMKDNHKSIGVQLHTVIDISLKSCHDCGYHWARSSSSAVKLIAHRYIQHTKPGEVGGMGAELWRFKVVKAQGKGSIKLNYISPARKVAKTFAVSLKIS